MHGGEAEKRVLDIVAGENRDRARGVQPALRQRRRNGPDCRERLRVAHRAPPGHGVALREKYTIRCEARPMRQSFGQHARIWRQRMRRAHQERAVAAPLHDDVGRPEFDRA
jgi:hypothetical protein